jgi:hypothetical protein
MIEDRDTRPIGRRVVDEGRRATGCTVLFVPEPTLVAQVAKAHSEGRLEDRSPTLRLWSPAWPLPYPGQAWWSLRRRVIFCPTPDKRATLIRKFGRSMTARLRADEPGGDGSDLKPDAGTAVASVARVEEDKTGAVERFLNCGERAGARVGPTPLQVLYGDFGETRRLSELGLRPIEQPYLATAIAG